jgi:hypothetical protein
MVLLPNVLFVVNLVVRSPPFLPKVIVYVTDLKVVKSNLRP